MSIRSYIQEVKEYRRKERQKKKDDKELLKKLEKEEEELEIDIPEADDEYSIKHIIDAVKNDPDLDEELMSYLTDEEKATLEHNKKEEKRLYIILGSIFGVICIIAVVAIYVLSHQGGGTLLETIQPRLEEYLKSTYNLTERIVSVEQIEYRDIEGNIEDSNMYVATTTNDHKIVLFEDKNEYADNINKQSIYDEYNKLLRTITGDYDIISNSPVLSHKDYYLNYNLQLPYLDVLPTNSEFNTLYDSGKLTVADIIMYQGAINFNSAKTIINKFSNDSRFLFIKTNKGLPTHLTVISKTENYTLTIKNTLEPIEGINYYELDTSNNAVTNFEIRKVKDNSMELAENHEAKNAYIIDYRARHNHPTEEFQKAEYFFVSMDKNLISTENIIIFDEIKNLDKLYGHKDLYDYPLLYTANIGGKIYLIGNSTMGIANSYQKEESFLCKIGLC